MSNSLSSSFKLPSLNIPKFEPLEVAEVYRPQIWSKDQFEIIKRHIKSYEQTLDSEHEVGVMLTNYGETVLMQVVEISYEADVVLIFKGYVGGRMSTLIQHINQLNFLLTSVKKEPERPKRQIGFVSPDIK